MGSVIERGATPANKDDVVCAEDLSGSSFPAVERAGLELGFDREVGEEITSPVRDARRNAKRRSRP